jgi:histidinol phosphatase-like enzyme (inositol monophosphatase family)
MSPVDLSSAAVVAEAAADAARREILPRFRNVPVQTKSDGSPVTEADRQAERAIREILRGYDPSIGILGEEYGGEGELSGVHWVVDPIDGTIAFSRGIGLFSTIIALMDEGEPVLGLIDLPCLGERTVGWRGGGVRRNGTPVRVSTRRTLTGALVSCGDRFCFERFGAEEAYLRMAAEVPLLRGYTDAFGHAQVLHGGIDAMVDVNLNPWDAAATQVLVPEAGGRCITLDRREQDRGLGLVFGSPPLVELLAEYLG